MRKMLGFVGMAAWTLILIIVLLVGGDGSQTTNPDRGPAFMVAIYFFATAIPKIWMVLGRKDKMINVLLLVFFAVVVLYFMTTPNNTQASEFTSLQLIVAVCLIAMPAIDFCDLVIQFLLPKKW